jgi:pseudouridine-5'-phosphate glycosidase
MVMVQKDLGVRSAVLVANPVPLEDQLDPQELDGVLERAWAAAEVQGIQGQASTPFLLDFIRVATDGRSLDANVALYNNNIRLAVEIAKELAGRRSQ